MIKYADRYTADDEEPNCGNCDHVCCESDYPCKNCGPEYGWAYYTRTEIKSVSEDTLNKVRRLLGR